MKVVINTCYGGFGLSHDAMLRYFELQGWNCYPVKDKFNTFHYWKVPKDQQDNNRYSELTVYDRGIERTDPLLIKVIEELGTKADDRYAKLRIVEIPDGISWYIHDYDGIESIEEAHRSWS